MSHPLIARIGSDAIAHPWGGFSENSRQDLLSRVRDGRWYAKLELLRERPDTERYSWIG